MKKSKKYLFFLPILTVLSSCDAMLSISYCVQNKTNKPIKLKIEGYVDTPQPFYVGKDTIVELKPNGIITVGYNHGIGFPWGSKQIFRERPGICNFSIVTDDSIISPDCNDKYWKYRWGSSNYKIKNKRLLQQKP